MASKVKQVFPSSKITQIKGKKLRKDHNQMLIANEVLLLLQSVHF